MKTGIAGASVVGIALLAHIALAQEPPVRVLGLMKAVVIPASERAFLALSALGPPLPSPYMVFSGSVAPASPDGT